MDRRLHYGVVVLVLIVLTVFGSLGLGRFGYSMVLPAMQQALGLSNAQTGALQSCNLLGYLLTVVGAGVLASRFGPRVVIAVGLAVTGLAMAGTGWLPVFGAACVGRFLAGVGGAASNVPAMGLVSAWFASSRRGVAAGIAVAGSSLGLVVTGPLVPYLLARDGTADGWRLCWYVFGGLALGVCVLAALLLRNRPADMGLTPLGVGPGRGGAGGSTAGGTGVHTWREVWRSSRLWHLAAVYAAFGFSYIIFSTFFVRHLVGGVGLEQAAAGRLWLRIGLASTVSGLVWGVVSDRWGRRRALLLVFAVQGCAYLAVASGTGLTAAYIAAGLFAATAWSVPAIMAALAGDLFGPSLAPAALGLMTITFGVGQALGPYLGGGLADLTHSFALPFLLAGVVALGGGLGGALLLPRGQA